jgi:hypothetical protein
MFGTEEFIEKFKKFIVSNNIISVSVGVIIAYAAWDLIQSAVSDAIFPGMYFLFFHWAFGSNHFVSSMFEPMNKLNLPRFTQRFLSFMIMLLVTYLSIDYAIKNMIEETPENNPPSTTKFPPGIKTTLSPSSYGVFGLIK